MESTTEVKDRFDTGKKYSSNRDLKGLPAGMYLGLFHGRKDKDEDMDGWGTDGPLLGPFKYVHTTYGSHIRACMTDEHDPSFEPNVVEDMILYNDVYYGDWTIFYHDPSTSKDDGE